MLEEYVGARQQKQPQRTFNVDSTDGLAEVVAAEPDCMGTKWSNSHKRKHLAATVDEQARKDGKAKRMQIALSTDLSIEEVE